LSKFIWITGLAGSGKSTIGQQVYERLKAISPATVLLDGDKIRNIFGDDLGHDPEGRIKNARRIANLCKFLVGQDINVVCATMSLYSEIHELNRSFPSEYYEIFLECSMDELRKRDQKGLYSLAMEGKAKNIVGVDLAYDKPEKADLVLSNLAAPDIEKNVERIMELILS
jgi:adenylylsulfate kinase-like enzyme